MFHGLSETDIFGLLLEVVIVSLTSYKLLWSINTYTAEKYHHMTHSFIVSSINNRYY